MRVFLDSKLRDLGEPSKQPLDIELSSHSNSDGWFATTIAGISFGTGVTAGITVGAIGDWVIVLAVVALLVGSYGLFRFMKSLK